jgi:hypothetical protein
MGAVGQAAGLAIFNAITASFLVDGPRPLQHLEDGAPRAGDRRASRRCCKRSIGDTLAGQEWLGPLPAMDSDWWPRLCGGTSLTSIINSSNCGPGAPVWRVYHCCVGMAALEHIKVLSFATLLTGIRWVLSSPLFNWSSRHHSSIHRWWWAGLKAAAHHSPCFVSRSVSGAGVAEWCAASCQVDPVGVQPCR